MASTLKQAAPGGGEQPLAIPEPPRRSLISSQGPASILLVDDDDKSLRALGHVLDPLHQHLVLARSGEEALRWLLREEFALILLDMRMPGLDGLQTARYINARARTRHIPIIFLTAQPGDVELVFGAHAAGAVDYVSKPFDPEVLRSKVAVFVELHNARAEHVHEARARAEAEGVASTISKLQSISDAALAHLELRELIPEILKRAAGVFAADASALLLRTEDDSSLTVFTSEGVERFADEEQLVQVEQALGPALGRSPTSMSELPPLGDLSDVLGGAAGSSSVIAAPLVAPRGPLGMLFLASRDPRRFTDEDLVVLKLSAERAGMAVEHARSYERERGLVEMLQDHLLPDQLPQIPGLAMAARYRPSERLAQVGGDWYDAIMLADGCLGLVIGDVVGHGIGAATLMAELRAALRAYAIADPGSPARAISSLNALVASTHGRMVATLLYMVVNANGTHARFASAGHPPPLLASGNGTRFLAPPTGAPLGVTSHTSYEDFECELEPGSTLLLYTDGLVERRGEVIDAGLARLTMALASAPHDLEDLCAHVLACAEDGSRMNDDTALVAVRRLERDSNLLELTLRAEPESIPEARHRLTSWLMDMGASPQKIFDIALAANEACTNAVEHAYGPERDASFKLVAESTPAAVVVRVSDLGGWRAPRGSKRGHGLRVIAQLMDGLDVRRTTNGTTVEMTKAWSEHART
jgi:serine phosphatase RsbU (regulator of sigma subunit)/DNA-binding response OmpR family regulator/anti-sigma regulatory factor (Ser/Thr protein kinase)